MRVVAFSRVVCCAASAVAVSGSCGRKRRSGTLQTVVVAARAVARLHAAGCRCCRAGAVRAVAAAGAVDVAVAVRLCGTSPGYPLSARAPIRPSPARVASRNERLGWGPEDVPAFCTAPCPAPPLRQAVIPANRPCRLPWSRREADWARRPRRRTAGPRRRAP